MKFQPESAVKKDIKDYLHSRGAYFFMPVQMGYGADAVDLFCCVNSRFVAIETKKTGVTECTPRQRRCLEEVRKAGGIAFVADSLETVKLYLE